MSPRGKADQSEEAALAGRAKAIKDEAASVKDALESRLQETLRETDSLIQDAISVEAQVQHFTARRDELGERLRIASEREQDALSIVENLQRDVEESERLLSEHEREMTNLRKKASALEVSLSKADAERAAAEKEVARLEKQKQRLEDDLRRLKKLRQEYLQAIAQFREAKEELAT